jgi:lipopolysaccharide transport system permease protein
MASIDPSTNLAGPQSGLHEKNSDWDLVISAQHNLLNIPFSEIWRYRDLLLLMVRRDFVALYKQTILGPLWFLIQPILTTIVFTIIFGNIAKISTDGLPHVLFYMSGITCWNYFAECLTKTSETFTANASIFGKVYFPRIIMPLSIVVSGLLKFAIQFVLFGCFIVWFIATGTAVHITPAVFLFPLLVLIMGMLGLGLGMIISSLTTKYRDLRFLLQFGIQLMMYATPIIYPVSSVPEKYHWLIFSNPMTAIVETFRYGFLGSGSLNITTLSCSAAISIFILVIGTIIFNRVEKTFMDTV